MMRRALVVGGGRSVSLELQALADSLSAVGWEVQVGCMRPQRPPFRVGRGELLLLHNVPFSQFVRALVDDARASGGVVVASLSRAALWRTSRFGSSLLTGGAPPPLSRRLDSTAALCDGLLISCREIGDALTDIEKPWRPIPVAIGFTELRLATRAFVERASGIDRGDPTSSQPDWRMRLALVVDEDGRFRSAGGDLDLSALVADADGQWELAELASLSPRRTGTGLLSTRELSARFDLREPPEGGSTEDEADAVSVYELLGNSADPSGEVISRPGELQEAIAELAAADVLLAPCPTRMVAAMLKAELAVLLSAAVGVPAIAASESPVSQLIDDGISGFVVGGGGASQEAWQEAIRRLAEDHDLRWRMGLAARARALATISPHACGDRLDTALCEIANGVVPRRHNISIDVSAGDCCPGEAAMVHSLQAEARRAGCTLVETPAAEYSLHAASSGVRSAAAAAPAGESDLLLAADDHAMRHPMGPELLAAEEVHRAYRQNLALGPWLADWLGNRYGAHCWSVPYPVDSSVFFPGPWTRSPIILHNVQWMEDPPERDVGLQALLRLCSERGETQLLLYGPSDDPLARLKLPIRYRWLGQLAARERAYWFRKGAILLAGRGTNVSIEVLEAMSCGCAIVAVQRAEVAWLLTDRQSARIAPSRPEILADIMGGILDRPEIANTWRQGAYEAIEGHDMGRTAGRVVRALDGLRCGSGQRNDDVSLDLLQPDASSAGPNLENGRVVTQRFVCRRPGLCRIDVRIDWGERPSSGPIRLRLLPHPNSRTAIAAADAQWACAAEDWATLRFEPIGSSAGLVFYLAVDREEPGRGPSVGLSADAAPALGAAVLDGRPQGGSLALRTFCKLRNGSAIGPDPALGPPQALLAVLDQEAHQLWKELEAARSTLPYRLAHAADWLMRPLPPVSDRPWPPEAPYRVKLLGTLRHYGPLALVSELVEWLRWQRLTADERRAAHDQEASR